MANKITNPKKSEVNSYTIEDGGHGLHKAISFVSLEYRSLHKLLLLSKIHCHDSNLAKEIRQKENL